MKIFYNILIMMFMVSLCTGYVCAIKSGGETNVQSAIQEKESLLMRNPLVINDSNDVTEYLGGGVFVSESTIPAALKPTKIGPSQSLVSSQSIGISANYVPKSSVIEYGSDGKTRVFTSKGVEMSYSVDNRVEQIPAPSGKLMPANHIIGIPDGAVIHPRGNRTYVSINNEVILTVIDRNAQNEPGFPLAKGASWVEYAESDPQDNIRHFSSSWTIPHSPTLIEDMQNPSARMSNMVWNGIEPSDGSSILQPVTAFNYYAHSEYLTPENRTDPFILENWTGASWFCGNICYRSTPAISFSEGAVAQGNVYRIPSVATWIIDLENVNTGQSSGLSLEDSSFPYRAVVVYEWASTGFSGGITPRQEQEVASTTFSDLTARDASNLPISLTWNSHINHADHLGATGLYVDLSQLPSTIKLCTDCTTFVVTPAAGVGGRIEPASPVTALAGADQTFTVTPDSGYAINDVMVNGASVGAVSSYTFTNIQHNSTINATFAPSHYYIKATAGSNGNISPCGLVEVSSHSNRTFTITPIPGYGVLNLVIDGISVVPISSYTFSDIVANHTINATFARSVGATKPGVFLTGADHIQNSQMPFTLTDCSNVPVIWDGTGSVILYTQDNWPYTPGMGSDDVLIVTTQSGSMQFSSGSWMQYLGTPTISSLMQNGINYITLQSRDNGGGGCGLNVNVWIKAVNQSSAMMRTDLTERLSREITNQSALNRSQIQV